MVGAWQLGSMEMEDGEIEMTTKSKRGKVETQLP